MRPVHVPLPVRPGCGFLLGAVAVLSPFLLIQMARFLLARDDGHGYARLVFWLSTLGFLAA